MADKILIAYFSHPGQSYVGKKIVNLEVGNTKVAVSMIKNILMQIPFILKQKRPIQMIIWN
ncbi:MAG: hypothetical protein PHP50_12015 [Lachnospiraceae bacterium]|nr:hypothetical protein [Lachnospiraceae bacterium]